MSLITHTLHDDFMPLNPIDRILFAFSLNSTVNTICALKEPKATWIEPDNIQFDDSLKLELLDVDSSFNKSTWNARYLSNEEVRKTQKALSNLFIYQCIKITVEVQQVDGLAASKGNTRKYATLDDFVTEECLSHFEVNDKFFHLNYNHLQIAIIHDPDTNDYFSMSGWSERLYLVNGSDGSHHFSSMRYIAAKLNKNVNIHGDLLVTYLDSTAVQYFNQNYKAFLINSFNPEIENKLNSLIDLYSLPCIFFTDTSRQKFKTKIIIFKKSDWKLFSFQESALKNVLTDFNIELVKHLDFQSKNLKFQKLLLKEKAL